MAVVGEGCGSRKCSGTNNINGIEVEILAIWNIFSATVCAESANQLVTDTTHNAAVGPYTYLAWCTLGQITQSIATGIDSVDTDTVQLIESFGSIFNNPFGRCSILNPIYNSR